MRHSPPTWRRSWCVRPEARVWAIVCNGTREDDWQRVLDLSRDSRTPSAAPVWVSAGQRSPGARLLALPARSLLLRTTKTCFRKRQQRGSMAPGRRSFPFSACIRGTWGSGKTAGSTAWRTCSSPRALAWARSAWTDGSNPATRLPRRNVSLPSSNWRRGCIGRRRFIAYGRGIGSWACCGARARRRAWSSTRTAVAPS